MPDYLAGLGEGVFGARGLRIGIDAGFNGTGADAKVVELTEAAAEVLAGLGARLRPVDVPDVGAVLEGWRPFCAVETAIAHEATFPSRADEYGSTLRGLIEMGRALGVLDLAKHLIERDKFKGRLVRVFGEVDLVLVPAMYLANPTFERMNKLAEPKELAMLLRFTAPFDVSGSPTITLPCGFTEGGLPVAFQLVGPHLSEALLLRAGHAYQQATAWHSMHPEL